MYVTNWHTLKFKLSLSLSLSHSLALSHSLTLTLTLSLSLSLRVCLYPSLCLSLFLHFGEMHKPVIQKTCLVHNQSEIDPSQCVCIYVYKLCVCVCIYVCMYVCMYVNDYSLKKMYVRLYFIDSICYSAHINMLIWL